MNDLPKYLESAIVNACQVSGRMVLEAALRVAFAPIAHVEPSHSEEFDKAFMNCLRVALRFDRMPECGKDFMSAIIDVCVAIDREIAAS